MPKKSYVVKIKREKDTSYAWQFNRQEKANINKALERIEGWNLMKRSWKNRFKKSIMVALLCLLPSVCYGLPNKATIQEVLYEHKQISLKVDLLYKMMRKEFIKKYGKKEWDNFVLNAGVDNE